jgi:branched-chain amino acid transport system permease protein
VTAVAATGRRRRLSGNAIWAISLSLFIIAIFLLYKELMPNLQDNIAADVQSWLPLTAVNECMIFVIMALGLNVVVGYAGLLDLGYVAFWAIGSYMGAYLASPFVTWGSGTFKHGINLWGAPTPPGSVGLHINFWVALLIGGIACAISGILIGAPTLRLRGDYLAIVTLGFGEIIPQFFLNGSEIAGHNVTNGNLGITPIDPANINPAGYIPGVPAKLTVAPTALPFKLLLFALLAAFCVFVSLRIREGRLGRSWLAIREDELAASMMGVPLMRAKLSAYAVGAFFGGVGGVAYATHVGGALPDPFKFSLSIFVLIMVVIGGMGNVWGVVVGAFVLAWVNNTGLQQFGSTYNSLTGAHVDFTNYNFLIFGVLLVLMMLFRREGFIPERRTRMLLKEPTRTEMEAMGSDIEAGQEDNTQGATEIEPGLPPAGSAPPQFTDTTGTDDDRDER